MRDSTDEPVSHSAPASPSRLLLSIAHIAAWTAPLAILGHVTVNGFDAGAPAGAMWVAFIAAILAVVAASLALGDLRIAPNQRRAAQVSLVIGVLSLLAMFVIPSNHYN